MVRKNTDIEARLAQSVERKALNLVVVGSSPTVGVSLFSRHDEKLLKSMQDEPSRGSTCVWHL